MRGALVFLCVFIAFLLITLGYSTLPPGKTLYQLLGVPETDYPVLGVPAALLVKAVFNGIVYGVIAWLIFTFIMKSRGKAKPS